MSNICLVWTNSNFDIKYTLNSRNLGNTTGTFSASDIVAILVLCKIRDLLKVDVGKIYDIYILQQDVLQSSHIPNMKT